MRACLVRMQTCEVTLLCFANANVYTEHNACMHIYTRAYGNLKMAACAHINLHLRAKDVCLKTLPQDTVSQLGCVVLLPSYQAYFKWLATSKRCAAGR
jgi:hypothetical protein